MKRFIPLVFIAALLMGCATTTTSVVPEGYSGEVAHIVDTYQRQTRGSATFFYTDNINNQKVANALNASASRSSGQGNNLNLFGASRTMPITPQRIHLVGQSFHIVPIVSMFSSAGDYTIEGWVDLTPKADTHYLIKGSVDETYSAVWIEDHRGNIVTEIIQRMGSHAEAASDSKKAVFDNRINADNPSKKALFDAISTGESLAIVNAKLGQPINSAPIADQRHLSIFSYKDVGSIAFSGDQVGGFFVAKLQPVIGATTKDLDQIKRDLATDHGGKLRNAVKRYYDQDLSNIDALDLFAQKLWQLRNADHRHTVDAMAWICRMIAKSNNGRYYELLQSVAVQSNQDKLRKWARKSLVGLSAADTTQFTPAN